MYFLNMNISKCEQHITARNISAMMRGLKIINSGCFLRLLIFKEIQQSYSFIMFRFYDKDILHGHTIMSYLETANHNAFLNSNIYYSENFQRR